MQSPRLAIYRMDLTFTTHNSTFWLLRDLKSLEKCAVALVLPLPDPQIPEQHEKCCILCKKPPEWKLNAMHHLRCRLHHYYKPKADCILLNRREWKCKEGKEKVNCFAFDCISSQRWSSILNRIEELFKVCKKFVFFTSPNGFSPYRELFQFTKCRRWLRKTFLLSKKNFAET